MSLAAGGLAPLAGQTAPNGGASGIQMIQHAMRALDAGDASTIVLVAGDHFTREDFRSLLDEYNRYG